MDGDNWNRNTTFLSDASVCEWDSQHGDRVGCDGAGQVTSLQLIERGLTGRLPDELALLFNLKGIYLSKNDISGRIPTRMGTLRSLEALFLSRNNLSGRVPDQI